MDEQEAIRQLQASDDYRIIQRLRMPDHYSEGTPHTPRIGLTIDVEATGLNTEQDRIIELGFVAFEYDAGSGRIYRVLHSYDGFEDPGTPLSDIVKQLTGIDDAMLKDQRLDDAEINAWLEKADLVIAHNAGFDRPMIERRLPKAIECNWACTLNDIDWQAENIHGRKLDYIAYILGFFFEGHRAVNDAEATLHLLSRPLPISNQAVMAALLEAARQPVRRLFATHAAFDKKDLLRANGYQWLPGFQYADRNGGSKRGVWSKAVSDSAYEAECAWLQQEIYNGKANAFQARDITPQDRYSVRETGR
jgi:DNA polymerase-3 subunit epsilon